MISAEHRGKKLPMQEWKIYKIIHFQSHQWLHRDSSFYKQNKKGSRTSSKFMPGEGATENPYAYGLWRSWQQLWGCKLKDEVWSAEKQWVGSLKKILPKRKAKKLLEKEEEEMGGEYNNILSIIQGCRKEEGD